MCNTDVIFDWAVVLSYRWHISWSCWRQPCSVCCCCGSSSVNFSGSRCFFCLLGSASFKSSHRKLLHQVHSWPRQVQSSPRQKFVNRTACLVLLQCWRPASCRALLVSTLRSCWNIPHHPSISATSSLAWLALFSVCLQRSTMMVGRWAVRCLCV